MTEYLLDIDGEPKITICNYDKLRCCNCLTKSILSEDRTHYNCEKCGAIKWNPQILSLKLIMIR